MRIATSVRMAVGIALAVGILIAGIVVDPASPPQQPTAAPSTPEPAAIAPPGAAAAERMLNLVCGSQPARLGSLFGDLELGRAIDRMPDVAPATKLGVRVELLTTGRRVDGVEIKVPFDPGWAGCYQFTDQLHRRWGPPSDATEGGETWRDVAHDRVATFTQNFTDCTVRFVRVVSSEQWLNETRSSLVPIWAIGHPVAELEAALGLPAGTNPGELRWQDESLGDPFSHVELTAHVRRGRVVGIGVAPPFGDDVADILWHRLKALYGAPTIVEGHEDTMQVRWRRPAISVGKYWGQDAIVPGMMVDETGRLKVEAPTAPRRPDADDGVLVNITFGSTR